ncbi:MAG: hypothetical protein KTR22_10235 [Flavobacteriaceae bacterium]|nr:hypothetical protein [Flavobacteriaceae bacterium]
MLEITCHKKDCPTPHFMVDPQGGRIPLIGAADTSEMKFTLQSRLPEIKAVIKRVEAQEEKEEFSEEDLKLLKEWCQLIEPKAPGKTKVEELETTEEDKFNDYMVVYCESMHKNYIPFYNPHKKSRKATN